MFDYIVGKKIICENGKIVVENNGIGYAMTVSDECIRYFSEKDVIKIYTYLSVREDGVSLYGFYNQIERAMFDKLISVSGIGPKVAVAILGGIPVDRLAANIISQDTNALNKIKGVGKKTAARIVLELKDKINKEYSDDNQVIKNDTSEIADNEAVMALMTLGFTKKEAVQKVSNVIVSPDMSIEEIIYQALKKGI